MQDRNRIFPHYVYACRLMRLDREDPRINKIRSITEFKYRRIPREQFHLTTKIRRFAGLPGLAAKQHYFDGIRFLRASWIGRSSQQVPMAADAPNRLGAVAYERTCAWSLTSREIGGDLGFLFSGPSSHVGGRGAEVFWRCVELRNGNFRSVIIKRRQSTATNFFSLGPV